MCLSAHLGTAAKPHCVLGTLAPPHLFSNGHVSSTYYVRVTFPLWLGHRARSLSTYSVQVPPHVY